MCWLKRNLWKPGIAIAGMLLLLVLMAWIPVSAADAPEVASGLAGPGTVTVQATPTVDATVTELNKEKLAQDISQQQHTWENWLWNNAASLALAIAGIFGIVRYFNDRLDAREKQEEEAKRLVADHQAERERRDEEQQRWLKDQEAEREKRAEERFQAAVTGLGDEREGARIGAAILLRTFLRPGYEEFYIQTFDLAVANLRLRKKDSNTPEPLDTLSQALITAFKESFPLARDRLKEENSQFSPQSLDASYIQLDNANLNFADLEQAWMPQASLREASLYKATLSEANLAMANLSGAILIEAKLNSNRTSLNGANLSGANLNKADLSQAYLIGADLSQADLSEANFSKASFLNATLSGANLGAANLSQADLSLANFSKASLIGANLSESHLSGANLINADLSYANLDKAFLAHANLSGADLSGARLFDTTTSLEHTDLRAVKGLTKEQLEACKAKGAIIDEPRKASSSQSTDSTPPSSHSSDGQAQLTPLAQGSVPTPDTDESSAPSSRPGSQS